MESEFLLALFKKVQQNLLLALFKKVQQNLLFALFKKVQQNPRGLISRLNLGLNLSPKIGPKVIKLKYLCSIF
jgi:hypothetical protein